MTAWEPTPGARIGDRYVLDKAIGEGGMAIVFEARDERLGDRKRVAIKFVQADRFGRAELVARLREEARNQSYLHHENVALVLDAGEEHGVPYIVLRLVAGSTLHDWLRAHPDAPVSQRLDVLRQVAAGLDYAHEAGVLHRDVKPSNVLIETRPNGTPRAIVSDFGLALRIDAPAAQRITHPGRLVGTPAYTAPELWRGGDATKASDVYAFGCLAYEIFIGRPPFSGTPDQIMHGHLHERPEPPSSAHPECRGPIDQMIASLLSKNPSRRPSSASAALAILPSSRSPTSDVRPSARRGAERPFAFLRRTGAHVLVFAGLFAAAFAAGRRTGAPATWATLAILVVLIAIAVFLRELDARNRTPGSTVGLESASQPDRHGGPPPTDTLAPLALPRPPLSSPPGSRPPARRSEEHTSELQSRI